MERRTSGVLIATLFTTTVTMVAQEPQQNWSPTLLADGQPNIEGMWNNSDAMFTPLELPEELAGQDLSPEQLQQRAEARAQGNIERSEWKGFENSRGVGGYGTYWFDWYWDKPVSVGAPSIIVEPANGRIPARRSSAEEKIAMSMAQLHDSAANMEAGDRCISRGVLGMMMPTHYNNGTLILQPPGYVVIRKEMIHNVRIIPIGQTPHLNSRIHQWEGDPRGHWEGNTLVIESTNFSLVENMRGPAAGMRSRQTEEQKVVERITVDGPDALRYSITLEDLGTYTAPWAAAFPFRRDSDYLQFEYACHEGNYSVPNALGGARLDERADAR